ncbi:hypothetical protein GX51_02379 [Blastomyces parvus]|uniref:Uncharacterized protein n=1 Tax=Blastomyces parvus TaxID=2060905 RepID=A0A2B7XCJ2_9EURO|nr:hypothetical protein GX51_02379 [Blastomyces parvus]
MARVLLVQERMGWLGGTSDQDRRLEPSGAQGTCNGVLSGRLKAEFQICCIVATCLPSLRKFCRKTIQSTLKWANDLPVTNSVFGHVLVIVEAHDP